MNKLNYSQMYQSSAINTKYKQQRNDNLPSTFSIDDPIHVISIEEPSSGSRQKPPDYEAVTDAPPSYDDAIKLNPSQLFTPNNSSTLSLPTVHGMVPRTVEIVSRDPTPSPPPPYARGSNLHTRVRNFLFYYLQVKYLTVPHMIATKGACEVLEVHRTPAEYENTKRSANHSAARRSCHGTPSRIRVHSKNYLRRTVSRYLWLASNGLGQLGLEDVGSVKENHRKPRSPIKSDQPKILTEARKQSSVHASFKQVHYHIAVVFVLAHSNVGDGISRGQKFLIGRSKKWDGKKDEVVLVGMTAHHCVKSRVWHSIGSRASKLLVTIFTLLPLLPLLPRNTARKAYLRCDKNLPVAWPEPSQPGIGHLLPEMPTSPLPTPYNPSAQRTMAILRCSDFAKVKIKFQQIICFRLIKRQVERAGSAGIPMVRITNAHLRNIQRWLQQHIACNLRDVAKKSRRCVYENEYQLTTVNSSRQRLGGSIVSLYEHGAALQPARRSS
ncbi:hypothetical protein WN51_14007 [Melipona quadrifasciata]|uniref:Uncharacterized protein n=1 Tax=Melipona quadrifasciata TaxID=166423 RepID=A0A0M9A1K5_9HYME|nr:hypothetical protein WN51_14007 [Melipona quadrifasciata]